MSATPLAPPSPATGTAELPARPAIRTRLVEAFNGRWRMVPVLLTLALMWVYFTSQAPAFLSPRNLSNLTLQIVVTTVLALGLVLVLLIGEIDLAVAAVGAVASAITARLLLQDHLGAGPAILAAVLVGAAIGAAQGALVTRFRAPAFIVTLGSSLILQGVLLELLPRTGQVPLAGTFIELIAGSYLVPATGYGLALLATAFVGLLAGQTHRNSRAQGYPSSVVRVVVVPVVACLVASTAIVTVLNAHKGVPTAVVLMLVLLAASAYLTTQTRFGVYLYAIGGNAEAARRAGIKVVRVKVITFAMTGALAAVAGVVAASRTLGVSAQSGGGTLLLEAVAAAVIGGASLFGGRGSVWAALLGALVIGSISNGLDLVGADAQLKLMIQGAVLAAAVCVDGYLATMQRRR